ncbi:NADH-quinone oxidoreductase subunit NuoN [Nakamurella leprariae]|uniref:NADH-quinone oxidoreductase subunit N n=1 Tax=Nakamurella leprariae TaxID=2803911 RepID=A0A939BV70_9ACTN|nr:NADH-quinone oxidoreductase subunit NuoN [Nakamurella leprariae]MBM9466238.1 NADH-quinone oxidoreductase subunit NuoN [Nakamurella leprariae]
MTDPSVPPIVAPSVDLVLVLPILVVLGAAVVGVLVEAFVGRSRRFAVQAALTLLTVAFAAVWTIVAAVGDRVGVTFAGSVSVDALTHVAWGVLLVLAVPAVLLVLDRTVEPGGAFVAAGSAPVGSAGDRRQNLGSGAGGGADGPDGAPGPAPMQTEVFPLILFAVGGMMIFPAASDLLTFFVALEVLSLPLYLLCGLARRRRLISQEAAVKYFLLGAFVSAILLYGIALLYGWAGSIRFADIAAKIAGDPGTGSGVGNDLLLLLGLALLVVGLLFKASVGPFHLWTPDVYQGAPTAVTAFMAACTKVAAFAAMLRVFLTFLPPVQDIWIPVLSVIAVVSMLIGSIIGVAQSDMKRVLAYSSIAHAGFILLGVMSLSERGASGTMFYLLSYGFATIGAFAITMLVRRGAGEATRLEEWSGLAKRSPVLAAVMTLFLLSFAGIPLTSGFIGKLTVFTAAVDAGLTPLVVIAMIATAITVAFYLRVVVVMYLTPTDRADRSADRSAGGSGPGSRTVSGAPGTLLETTTAPVSVVVPGPAIAIVLVVCALVTLLLGLAPSLGLDLLDVPLPLLS